MKDLTAGLEYWELREELSARLIPYHNLTKHEMKLYLTDILQKIWTKDPIGQILPTLPGPAALLESSTTLKNYEELVKRARARRPNEMSEGERSQEKTRYVLCLLRLNRLKDYPCVVAHQGAFEALETMMKERHDWVFPWAGDVPNMLPPIRRSMVAPLVQRQVALTTKAKLSEDADILDITTEGDLEIDDMISLGESTTGSVRTNKRKATRDRQREREAQRRNQPQPSTSATDKKVKEPTTSAGTSKSKSPDWRKENRDKRSRTVTWSDLIRQDRDPNCPLLNQEKRRRTAQWNETTTQTNHKSGGGGGRSHQPHPPKGGDKL